MRERESTPGGNNFAFFQMRWSDHDYHEDGGESIAMVQKRNIEALHSILQDNRSKNVVVGTHGTALSSILNYYDNDFKSADFMRIIDWMPYIIELDFDGNELISMQEHLHLENKNLSVYGDIMRNPWEEISLSDYESHMKLDTVMQMQALKKMMRSQFYQYPVKTIMILGIAGGNGLEHIDPQIIQKIYGVDINKEYLQECAARYDYLDETLECLCADLTCENLTMPYADLVVANLLLEYIGYECFEKVIAGINPKYISCIIQINPGNNFISDSPYQNIFDPLESVHHDMEEDELTTFMGNIGYSLLAIKEHPLPNGKKLVQLDYHSRRAH